MQFSQALKSFDWVLTGAALLLATLGLAMLFSTTTDSNLYSGFLIRQAVALVIGLGLYVALSLFPYHHLRRYAIPLYIAGLFSLIFVAGFGNVIRGSISRLEVLGVQLQPSEFVKVAVVIILAWLFAKQLSARAYLLMSAGLAGLAAALVAWEPDIGVAALIALLWFGLTVFRGTPWRTIGIISLIGLLGLGAAWQWTFADYQKERIQTFLNPTSDPLGAGYNVVQSIVALGSGHLVGRGLGHGPQSQLNFLPEQHTDFILASVGEELGFLGVLIVIALYITLLVRIARIAKNTADPFGQYLAAGVFFLLLFSFFVSAGMNMGLLPVTGIPLPLVSYGGSNLVSTLLLLALVQSVHIYNTWVRRPPAEFSQFT